jgi:hypothetical protein
MLNHYLLNTTKINVMKNLIKSSFIAVFAIAIALISTPVKADGHENFDITVQHNINGNSIQKIFGLPLTKELPVDVYVNQGETPFFTFELGDRVQASVPEGEYFIEVFLAGTDIKVLELDAGFIPAGSDVTIKAQRGAKKSITLR